MTTLKALVGNFVVVRYLIVNGKKYNRCELEKLLDTIDDLLVVPKNLSTEEIKAFENYVTECFNRLLSLKEEEEKSLEQKQEIEFLLERVYKIIERCRQLQALEQLVLRIMLTVKLYR